MIEYWFLFKANKDRLERLGFLVYLSFINLLFFIVMVLATIQDAFCLFFDLSIFDCLDPNEYHVLDAFYFNIFLLILTIIFPLPFHIYFKKRNLKVVKYINYGNTDSSVSDESIYENHFYWSFYELSNGKTISLQYAENLTNKIITSHDYEFSYANNYQFGQDFQNWFNGLKPVKDLKELKFPSKKEKECVKYFFYKNILKSKKATTNIVYVKS
jgi:hypothetical protein